MGISVTCRDTNRRGAGGERAVWEGDELEQSRVTHIWKCYKGTSYAAFKSEKKSLWT